MNPKDLIQKILKGEALSDEEKKALAAYDPDADKNSAAAAARKAAEAEAKRKDDELALLKAQIEKSKADAQKSDDAKLTEAQKTAKQLEILNAKIAEIEKAKAESDSALAAAQRHAAVERIRDKAGIRFAPGIDPAILNGAFESALSKIENLDDADSVSAAVAAFVAANKAAIYGPSGNGTGGGKFSPDEGGANIANPYADKSFNLTEQLKLESADPNKAAKFKAEASAVKGN